MTVMSIDSRGNQPSPPPLIEPAQSRKHNGAIRRADGPRGGKLNNRATDFQAQPTLNREQP